MADLLLAALFLIPSAIMGYQDYKTGEFNDKLFWFSFGLIGLYKIATGTFFSSVFAFMVLFSLSYYLEHKRSWANGDTWFVGLLGFTANSILIFIPFALLTYAYIAVYSVVKKTRNIHLIPAFPLTYALILTLGML